MNIPAQFHKAFTMNGTVPVSTTEAPVQPFTAPFTTEQIDRFIHLAKVNRTQSATDTYLYSALEKFPLKGKNVALLGSTSPWYESVLLAHGAIPSTQTPCSDPRIFQIETEKRYDALFLLSHLKTLGLGSNIDPEADLKEMSRAKLLLKSDGLLFLSIPVGKDRLVWNSHRIYGESRMKALFKGWRPTAYFGYTYEDLLKDTPRLHEPIIVLKPI